MVEIEPLAVEMSGEQGRRDLRPLQHAVVVRPLGCSEKTSTREEEAPPARRTRSITGACPATPRRRSHPSTQLERQVPASPTGIDSTSSKVKVKGVRPITSSRQSSALARVRTRADLAVFVHGDLLRTFGGLPGREQPDGRQRRGRSGRPW